LDERDFEYRLLEVANLDTVKSPISSPLATSVGDRVKSSRVDWKCSNSHSAMGVLDNVK
jgi:hypothetical protein